MIGERENFLNQNQYGQLNMRPYNINGNEINAFYDDADDLVFVLDNTINQSKPNVLLIINPSGDKKWDEILSGQYDVDLETIRPKQDNKYQKLDIEYSGLSVYDNLITAFLAGDDLSEHLIQLDILRDSAARHSAMTRLNVANEIISKTNVTIVKTKESIVRLQNRIKALRAKLSATKKEIGKVSTKQSAAKILKLESQIEATTEKLKRAQKRLDSAQKRLDVATVDAELASDLLNQPALEIQQNVKTKPVMVAPKYEMQPINNESDDDDSDVTDEYDSDNSNDNNDDDEIKPLFDENPNNLNEDIAFKPINFDMPVVSSTETDTTNIPEPMPVFEPITENQTTDEETEEEFVAPDFSAMESTPVLESMTPISEQPEEQKSVLESMTPVPEQSVVTDTVPEYQPEPIDVQPITNPEPEQVERPSVVPPVPPVPHITNPANTIPVAPTVNTFNANVSEQTTRSKPTLVYYLLLLLLIILSVFTLWLYQKNMGTNNPVLTNVVSQTSESTEKTDNANKNPNRFGLKKQIKESKTTAVKVTEKPVAEKTVSEPSFEFVDEVVEPSQPNTDEFAGTTPSENVSDTFESQENESAEPVIINAVPKKVLSADTPTDDEVSDTNDEYVDEASVNKPVYEVGSRHDNMFISEQDFQETPGVSESENEQSDEDMYQDEEEYDEE